MCPFTKTSSPKYAFKLKFNCSFEKFNTCEMFKIAKLVPQKSSEVEISETSAGQSPSHCCLPTEFPIKKFKLKVKTCTFFININTIMINILNN